MLLAKQHEDVEAAAMFDPEDSTIASLAVPVRSAIICYECGATFSGLHSLRMHARTAHGYRSPTMSAVHGTACLCCLRDFHSLSRLTTQHLKGSAKCFERIIRYVAPASASQLEELRSIERAPLSVQADGRFDRFPCPSSVFLGLWPTGPSRVQSLGSLLSLAVSTIAPRLA